MIMIFHNWISLCINSCVLSDRYRFEKIIVTHNGRVTLGRSPAGGASVQIALPLRGHVQSLNASASAAALLYGILQRRDGP